jgi:hypothetical protein
MKSHGCSAVQLEPANDVQLVVGYAAGSAAAATPGQSVKLGPVDECGIRRVEEAHPRPVGRARVGPAGRHENRVADDAAGHSAERLRQGCYRVPDSERRVEQPDRIGRRHGGMPTPTANDVYDAVTPDYRAEVVQAFRHARADRPRVGGRVVDLDVGQPGPKRAATAENPHLPADGAGPPQPAALAHGCTLVPRVRLRRILDAQPFHSVGRRTLAADCVHPGSGIGRGEGGHVEGARAGQRRDFEPLVAGQN